jgi:hypothetical protein
LLFRENLLFGENLSLGEKLSLGLGENLTVCDFLRSLQRRDGESKRLGKKRLPQSSRFSYFHRAQLKTLRRFAWRSIKSAAVLFCYLEKRLGNVFSRRYPPFFFTPQHEPSFAQSVRCRVDGKLSVKNRAFLRLDRLDFRSRDRPQKRVDKKRRDFSRRRRCQNRTI